jgi:hypothetical protein
MIKIIIIIIIAIIVWNYDKIPSYNIHKNRNINNIVPIGSLTKNNNDKELYTDNNGVLWRKRSFLQSLLHDPFANYVFESYDKNKISSSEVLINKKLFDNGKQSFIPSSFNFYSSYEYPISHIFADVIPIILYP